MPGSGCLSPIIYTEPDGPLAIGSGCPITCPAAVLYEISAICPTFTGGKLTGITIEKQKIDPCTGIVLDTICDADPDVDADAYKCQCDLQDLYQACCATLYVGTDQPWFQLGPLSSTPPVLYFTFFNVSTNQIVGGIDHIPIYYNWGRNEWNNYDNYLGINTPTSCGQVSYGDCFANCFGGPCVDPACNSFACCGAPIVFIGSYGTNGGCNQTFPHRLTPDDSFKLVAPDPNPYIVRYYGTNSEACNFPCGTQACDHFIISITNSPLLF
jgi:hypothetical protein